MNHDKIKVGRWDYAKVFGFSVRCVKGTVTNPTGLKESTFFKELSIYPNPTTGILTLEGIKGKFEVYNSYGKLIEVTKSNTLDLSQAASGIYLLKATDENGRAYLLKIVKE